MSANWNEMDYHTADVIVRAVLGAIPAHLRPFDHYESAMRALGALRAGDEAALAAAQQKDRLRALGWPV